MGGSALKSVYTERCSDEKYRRLQGILTEKLKKVYDSVYTVKSFNNKLTHGDIDIICAGTDIVHRDIIINLFSPKEIFKNGNCYSFDFDSTQIDIITCLPENLNSYINYYNWNDLGNFIGKFAHRLGVKYGQEGLFIEYDFKGKKVGKIMVSTDYNKIYQYFDLDYNEWVKGFDTLEDIFKFITTSKYFGQELFQYENLTKVNRERDRRRKSYELFLEYIKGIPEQESAWVNDQTSNLFKAKEYFPEANIEMEVRRLEYEECKKLYIQAKFNGGEVMRRFGLTGSNLGDAMTAFKIHICKHRVYEDFILENKVEDIYYNFKVFLDVLKLGHLQG